MEDGGEKSREKLNGVDVYLWECNEIERGNALKGKKSPINISTENPSHMKGSPKLL